MIKPVVFIATLVMLLLSGCMSSRSSLDDGWTADGVPFTLPHCWNVEDGTDGPTDMKSDNHNSVGGTGYTRKKVVYARNLPRYEFREDGFYVDGRKTFLKGVCYHQDRAGKGWAISAEDEEADIRLIKEMGANAIRTSHYPQGVGQVAAD